VAEGDGYNYGVEVRGSHWGARETDGGAADFVGGAMMGMLLGFIMMFWLADRNTSQKYRSGIVFGMFLNIMVSMARAKDQQAAQKLARHTAAGEEAAARARKALRNHTLAGSGLGSNVTDPLAAAMQHLQMRVPGHANANQTVNIVFREAVTAENANHALPSGKQRKRPTFSNIFGSKSIPDVPTRRR
jgi:hypothetical protein